MPQEIKNLLSPSISLAPIKRKVARSRDETREHASIEPALPRLVPNPDQSRPRVDSRYFLRRDPRVARATVVRGVNWLLVKRSFVRFLGRTEPRSHARFRPSKRFMTAGSVMRRSRKSRYSLFVRCPPMWHHLETHLSHLHSPACSSPTRLTFRLLN